MNKIFSFGKKKGQSPSRPSNKLPSYFGVQTPYPTEGYLIRSKDLGKIHKAAFLGDVAKVQQLLLLGKNTVNDLDKVKRTPLHLACANGHTDVVCLLVERKCHLNLLDKDSRTPLMKAIECRQEECATILLEHGADPNLGDGRNNNALHYIASGQTKFMAEKLVKHKIDIEAKNKEGLTPLLLAVSTMNFEMAGFLLKNGANVNALDSCKRTALMIAVSVGSIGLVTLLLQNNADYTLQDIAGWTAQTYAERYGYPVHIYHKQIEKQLERNNFCPPQISCSEKTSGTSPSLDTKAEESSPEDSISRLSDEAGPDDALPSTDDELDFDTECSHKSLLETSARRLFVSRNQNIKEKIPLRKSEDFMEEFDLTDADDIDDLKEKLEFKGSSDRSQETFDKRDQEQHSHENYLEISARRELESTNQNIKDSISLGQHEGRLMRNSNGKPIQPTLQMKDSFPNQEVGKGVMEKREFDALKWDSTSTSLIKESHKSSKDMKLQSNYPGKSLPLNQNQLPFTKYEKIPSIIGEAIVGIGPVIDYKVGVQLEKPDPQKECSKDMKLQNNYPGKSLPLSQNQLASTRFGKMSSEEGEAVVGIGPVIDYKVGVKLEKPFPQKECSRDRKLQSNYPGKSLLWCQNQLPSTKFEKIPSKEDKAVIGIGPVIDYKIGVHLEKLVPQDFSKDMKLQDNYLSKSLPLSQNQLASTKFGKMPSEEGEAIVGIGPVVNYKVGIQLEKTVSQECSKDMKLQSNYTSKSLPLNQSQLPSSRFRKIPSQEEEVAVVGSGHVIDYKVGVHLEKPIPQKQYEPPLQKENWKEVKKDLEQELKYKEPSELPEMSSALANNLSDSVEKEKNKGPFSVGDLQSLSGQREDNPENVFLKDLKISFPKNVLQFSSYMCSKRRTPQSKNKPKIEPTCNVSEENIAYVAENIKRSDSKLVINEIKEDKLFGIEITFSQQKNITNLESDSGLLQSSGPGSHFGVQLMHSGNMTSINQEKKPELITARKCKKKTKHIETSFQNSHHNATSSINELRLGRHSLLYGDTISKMFLDKELKQDKQRLTNELGIMQAESLTFKKENIQPEKEVEEKKQNHQQNKMKTLDRKDDDKLTENRRASKANEQFSMESHQHGKDEENKIPAEEIPIMSISSKEYLVPVHHVLKGKNVKKPEDEKLISKDSSTTSEKVNSSSGILFHSNDDSTLSETDSDELRLTKITLYEKNKDEIEMAADALDNLTQSHNRATDDYDLSLSNYVQGSPCLQEDQNAILSSDLSVKFKYSQLTQLTRKVMSLENTIRELQENFSERIKTEFQLMHQKVECNTCRGRLESEKQNKEKLQAEIDYPSCVSSDTEHQTSKLNLLQETDEWLVLKDQLIYEIGILSIKLSKAENEINQLRDSLREKTLILENTHRELNQTKDNVKELEHKKHMEKEKSNRSFLTKVSMQEGLTQMQRGIQLLPEPFEDVQNTEVFKRVVSNGVQVQFNDRSMTLYAENEKQDCMIEERNKESDDEYVYLRKQIHKYEHEKAETEHVIRKLQEVVHAKKEESMTSQEIMSPYQKVLDVKPLWKELDQNKSKLQESQEENEQLQWCINELEDYVQKIKMENSIFEDSVKEQMCKNEKFQKNILDTTLTQGVEKDNLGKQMEDRLQELKAELSQMKISHEKCKAELETYRRRSQDSGEYAGLYLNSSWHPPDQHQIKPLNWFGETEPTNTWSITNLYQKIFWNNF